VKQVEYHNIIERTNELLHKATMIPPRFGTHEARLLNQLDAQITEIMLSAERDCSRKSINRQPWSPQQRTIARTYSYWQQKAIMAAKQSFNWHHLNQLRQSTEITLSDHATMDITIINHQKTLTRNKWKSCKKRSYELRKKFLYERANYLATKMRTTEEKALCAIIRSEDSRRIYRNIKELLGKQQQIFTQVDIKNPSPENNHPHTTLTEQLDIEREILSRNSRHSLQSYQTPFLSNSMLHDAIKRKQQIGPVS
jgi:hypothetical protein